MDDDLSDTVWRPYLILSILILVLAILWEYNSVRKNEVYLNNVDKATSKLQYCASNATTLELTEGINYLRGVMWRRAYIMSFSLLLLVYALGIRLKRKHLIALFIASFALFTGVNNIVDFHAFLPASNATARVLRQNIIDGNCNTKILSTFVDE